MRLSKYIVICLLVAAPAMALSQALDQSKPAVKVVANPVGNKITLRWAPTTAPAWDYGNTYGYSVQRLTIMRNNATVTSRNMVYLSRHAAPKPLPQWEQQVKENKYAAVAAQALYGKTFQLKGGNVAGMMNKVKESEQRFSFALFAADYSPVVADMSGLSIVDVNVDQQEHYLYKVWVNMPDKKYPIDTGFVYTGLKEQRPLPTLPRPEVTFMDKQAVIAWNYGYYVNSYIAYFVERSADGTNFSSISKEPIVPTEDGTPTGLMHVIDSLKDNGTSYQYRIQGVSVFGTTGPYSPTVEGKGKKALTAAPTIRAANVVAEDKVRLQWEYPAVVTSELKGFQVERAMKPKGPFSTISPLLKPEVLEYVDQQPASSNYYRIVALGEDDRTYSFPHLAQLPDSIPPAPPTALKGSIDTTGVVRLEWNANKEKDLLGYRVFRSNFENDEYTQVTVSPVKETTFADTVSLKTLTRNVYYKVMAVDRRFNPSPFSSALSVARPDVLPPSAPAFRSIEYFPGKGVVVAWNRSGSSDIQQHVVYRRMANDATWSAAATFTDTTSVFVDNKVENKNVYAYAVIAQDISGLSSKPSSPITITVNDRGNKPSIEKFSAKQDTGNKQIVLSWAYDASDVEKFWIYRNGTDGKLRLLDSVDPDVKQFRDKQVTVNTQYQYSIKAVFKDGAHSPFSKPVMITY